MNRKTLAWWLLGPLLALQVAVAQAGGDLPGKFQGEVTPFPGADVLRVIDFPKSVMVRSRTTDTPQRVADFFVKDMTARGWRVQIADATAQGAFLVMTKDTRRFLVEAEKGPDGSTLFNMSL